MKYRADIDGLRAVAVVPVVLFHAGLGFPGGFVGVDVFFVISGYLITALLIAEIEATGSVSLPDFYERRARRLFPALFAMLLATGAAAAALMLPQDLEAFAKSALAALGFASNLWFYSQVGYFDEAAHLKPLLHTWSLAVEEQFYLVFPLLLVAAARLLPRGWLAPAVALGAAASLMLAVRWQPWGEAAFYLPHPRAWELGVGAALALAPSLAPRARWQAEALGAAGLIAIGWACLVYSDRTPFPGWSALLPCLGAAAIIAAGRRPGGAATRLLAAAPMVWVGKLSYSFYLWHWPVIVFARYGLPRDLTAAEGAACVALSLGLAWLSLRFIETPVRRGRALAGRGPVFAASALGAAVLAAGAGAMLAGGGWPGRMPAEVAALLDDRGLNLPERRCHFEHLNLLSVNSLCVRGAATQPSFVLVGDSHAAALAAGLFDAAERSGVSGWQFTVSGFVPVAAGTSNGGRGEKLARFLHAHPDIKRIIVTGFWSLYSTDQDYREKKFEPNDFSLESRKKLQISLSDFVENFPDMEIIFLDDIPVGADISRKILARRAIRSSAPLPQGLPRSNADAYATFYRPIFENLTSEYKNVRYSEILVDALCGPEICPLRDAAGQIIYVDGDHLSELGSRFLAPALSVLFAPTPD